ncbi:MAG: preprotein translocase subunit SecE [Candidatus Gribaldobacteria bacterium]|nr:preprotein translocase subunit SecE [Candidatus Gribaldobacteria bacterium]
MANKITNFFKEVGVEAKKVDWPSREQTINYTILVIGISLGVAMILGILDAIFFRVLIR